MWNPWRGCHKYSEGCQFCYIHKGDAKRGIDTNVIQKAVDFDRPLHRYVRGAHKGDYKIASGQTVYVCFSSDFLLEDADPWRPACWDIIRERADLHFLFLTKRIDRLSTCLPADWGDGYDNVTVGCTIENQKQADYRLPLFDALPLKHKNIICQPMIGPIDLSGHLNHVELVVVGGESDRMARPLQYDWVLAIRDQCIAHQVSFSFRQCGTHFIKDGKSYTLPVNQLGAQAKAAHIDT